MTAAKKARPAPELLELGPSPTRSRTRRLALVVVLVLALTIGGWWVYRVVRPEPPRDLTLDDLRVAYGRLLKGEVTSVELSAFAEGSVRIRPAGCAPLVGPILGHGAPSEAIDGVSSDVPGGDEAELFTLRFSDAAVTERVHDRIADALASCRHGGGRLRIFGDSVQLLEGTVAAPEPAEGAVSYTFRSPRAGFWSVSVLAYANTITWQYREGRAAASTVAAQDLLARLGTELEDVSGT